MLRAPKLFVGVGNVLLRDDSIGVRAAEVLASLPLPPTVEVYDAGTVGLDAASVLEGRERVVVVDGIEANAPSGSIFRFTPLQLRPYAKSGVSLHDVHLLDALEETRLLGVAPQEVVIFAVQVADVSTGMGLSPPIKLALERVIHLAIRELGLPAEILKHAAAATLPWAHLSERSSPCN